mmetsp:Transcript_31360/g.91519  ORF Transcript_31360/g.91519 Transcript_31360/m.91519 type:complete len:333 (-) Transcript_31360:91-1089(-)
MLAALAGGRPLLFPLPPLLAAHRPAPAVCEGVAQMAQGRCHKALSPMGAPREGRDPERGAVEAGGQAGGPPGWASPPELRGAVHGRPLRPRECGDERPAEIHRARDAGEAVRAVAENLPLAGGLTALGEAAAGDGDDEGGERHPRERLANRPRLRLAAREALVLDSGDGPACRGRRRADHVLDIGGDQEPHGVDASGQVEEEQPGRHCDANLSDQARLRHRAPLAAGQQPGSDEPLALWRGPAGRGVGRVGRRPRELPPVWRSSGHFCSANAVRPPPIRSTAQPRSAPRPLRGLPPKSLAGARSPGWRAPLGCLARLCFSAAPLAFRGNDAW